MSTFVLIVVRIISASFILKCEKLQYFIVHFILNFFSKINLKWFLLLLSMKNSWCVKKHLHVTFCVDDDIFYSFLCNFWIKNRCETFSVCRVIIGYCPNLWRLVLRNKRPVSQSIDVFIWISNNIIVQNFWIGAVLTSISNKTAFRSCWGT